jgi:hypothetical protein
MNNSKKNTSVLIPSIVDIIFICLFLLLALSAGKDLLSDGDTGYHIRAGEYILETFSIPKDDIFSFITPPLPWTAHEWLSEVIMALVHKAFGLTGVVLFFSFIICLVYYLLYKMIKTDRDNIILATIIILLVLISSQIHWLARPHIFSLLLTLIWYYLLDQYQYHHKNYLYVFPPIMLLWVNLHGGFLAGFILIGIYLFGNGVQYITAQDAEKDIHKKKAVFLLLITVACVFVSLINPYTYEILLFPFNLISNKFIMDHVSEFMSPNFHNLYAKPFEITLILTLFVLSVSKKVLNIIELMLMVLFVHMSLYSARYVPLFCIIIAPILMKQIGLLLEKSNGKLVGFFKKRAENISEIDASTRGYFWPSAAILLVIVLAAGGIIDFKFDPESKPVAAVKFLEHESIKGNMFDNDEFGDYIIYAAWPQYKVFVDGRSDMYGVDIIKEYLKVVRIKPGWDEVLKKYDVKWIIFDAHSALSLFLMERDEWKLIYADKVANIFVKDIPENRYLIEKYPDVELVIPDPDEPEK